MLIRLVEFYGGPKCGEKRDQPAGIVRGQVGPWASRREYYVYDGAGRFVWSGTLEGHLIDAEVKQSKKRGGK